MSLSDIIISIEEAGERLDRWLAREKKLSRTSIQKQIKAGLIKVNGKDITPHYVLKEGDKVSQTEAEDIAPEPSRSLAPEASVPLEEIAIVAEDNDWLVINKPVGVLMHPAPSTSEPTVADWLRQRYPKINKVGDDPLRPGIVHRLDRGVSGLVVIAKTQKMFEHLKEQFKGRSIDKRYEALVYDASLPDEGTINFLIERSSQGHRMAAKPLNQTGREATTQFKVIRRFHNYALLSVVIKTGRTHQIRVHLAAYTHPIVGDELYGSPKHRAMNKKLKAHRIFLAATDLAFDDLTGERQSFSLPLPDDFEAFLKKLP